MNSDSDSDEDSADDFQWQVPIALFGVLVFIAFLLWCIRRWLQKRQEEDEREGDVEALDPSIVFRGTLNNLFSCCSEIVDESGGEDAQVAPAPSSKVEKVLEMCRAENWVDEDVNRGEKEEVASSADIKDTLVYLQERQKFESREESCETIRLAQQAILLQRNERPTTRNMGTVLVIGVDARPTVMAGYCVNLRKKCLEYYVVKTEHFPFPIRNVERPNEFEMKNFQFALALWASDIREFKKLRIYTDNNAIDSDNCEFGMDANELLTHFIHCEDLDLVHDDVFINRKKNLQAFAKFIQPADHFSRWEIDKGIDFLCKWYGIKRKHVRGTHKLPEIAGNARSGYVQTKDYYRKINMVKEFSGTFQCENCFVNIFWTSTTVFPRTYDLSNRGRIRRYRRKKTTRQVRKY